MNDVWNPSDQYNEVEGEGTGIRVNGSFVAVEVGKPFAEAVTTVAKNAGLGKFRVFKDGAEIKPSEAPDTITEGLQLDLRPYDVAG